MKDNHWCCEEEGEGKPGMISLTGLEEIKIGKRKCIIHE
jgi:hypothetical protein